MENFSLFRGDFANWVLSRICRPLGDPDRFWLRIVFLLSATWGVMAALALIAGNPLGASPRESLFLDASAYGQFLIAFPSLLIAESLLDRLIRNAICSFRESRIIVGKKNLARFEHIVETTARARLWWPVDVVLLAIVCLANWNHLAVEMTNGVGTWHARMVGGREVITLAGYWEWFIAVPLWLYMLARWIYKIGLWTTLLCRVSRIPLRLRACHPDGAGGLGFLASAQTGFGIVTFAVGVATASTVWHKVTIEGSPTGTFATDAPWVLFMLIAPVAFLSPLLTFTAQMYRVKMDDGMAYRTAFTSMSDQFHQKWMVNEQFRGENFQGNGDVQALSDMASTFNDTQSMRVVPFDLASVGRLVLSAATPMIPLFMSRYPVLSIISRILTGQ